MTPGPGIEPVTHWCHPCSHKLIIATPQLFPFIFNSSSVDKRTKVDTQTFSTVHVIVATGN